MAKHCSVNRKFLSIKLHYFFFLGAMGGILPYISLLAKELGISATALSLIVTLRLFSGFVSKCFFGFLADYIQNIKIIVFSLLLVFVVSNVSILFVPPLDSSANEIIEVQLECANNNELLLFPFEYEGLCIGNLFKRHMYCELQYRECNNNGTLTLQGTLNEMKFATSKAVLLNNSECVSNVEQSRLYFTFDSSINFSCGCVKNGSSFIKKMKHGITFCFCKSGFPPSSVYIKFQFWIFALLVIFSEMGSQSISSLSDVAAYEVLGEKPELYGRQRLWGTISWGLTTLFAGFLNDLATGENTNNDYSPGFYLMVVFVVIDLIVLTRIKLTKANFSTNILKDIGTVFTSCETVLLAIMVYIIGALNGLMWTYELWYLQELGATQILLGLAIAIQCLIGEVPMFFFSGWFIKTFGYFYCLTGSLIAFTIRFGYYFMLGNPWLVLPIEILHGFTFAISFAAMTGYASSVAPKGTEATMIAIFQSLSSGLGGVTGSLLGGAGFDKFGGRYTFLIAAIISLLCVSTLLISRLVIQKCCLKEESRRIEFTAVAESSRKCDEVSEDDL